MADRPILFSSVMVLALLDGRKSQTRRILKPQPIGAPWFWEGDDVDLTPGWLDGYEQGREPCGAPTREVNNPLPVRFAKGDRLWVRESIGRRPASFLGIKATNGVESAYYAASDDDEVVTSTGFNICPWWKAKGGLSAIHMPRWASRLTLTVTDVRVERLQAITEADCLAEGAPADRYVLVGLGDPLDGIMVAEPGQPHLKMTPRNWCRELWGDINGAGSWDANPWVVAVSFKPERRNIDAEPMPYLIWSNVHGAWWGPNRAGYYATLSFAGRYTREEAIEQCANGRDGFGAARRPPELPVREIDAINRGNRSIDDLVLKEDRAECRARDLSRKPKVTA